MPAKPSGAEKNRLYFGDNLSWLQNTKEFPDVSADLVYLDPPFNSNADYNVLSRETSGQVSQAQFHAFTDTWSWADAAETGSRTPPAFSVYPLRFRTAVTGRKRPSLSM